MCVLEGTCVYVSVCVCMSQAGYHQQHAATTVLGGWSLHTKREWSG